MDDLKQISHEIAQAIFNSIEQDRTLILSRIADVIHKELAVRLPERKEPEPVQSEDRRAKTEKWRQMKEFMGIKEFMEMFPPAPDPQKMTATAVMERKRERERVEEEARRANAAMYQRMVEAVHERKVNPPVIEGSSPELNRPLLSEVPGWVTWDFATKKRQIS